MSLKSLRNDSENFDPNENEEKKQEFSEREPMISDLSRGESLLDEIEDKLQRKYTLAVMLSDANSTFMTEKQKREFRENELKEAEKIKHGKF